MSVLADVAGDLLIVRPPVPATCNKAGANYKSEVTHLDYLPRRAYVEWLGICDAIVASGGDALFYFEPVDKPYLGHAALDVDGDGAIRPAGSKEVLGNISSVDTGRVFTANGPWITNVERTLRAVMPHMLPHRRREAAYFEQILATIAESAGLKYEPTENPYRWEGMADVAVAGDKVVLTYAVAGHYDRGLAPKSARSSREGVTFAADHAGVPPKARIFAELVYPHFHGDTVHFGVNPPGGGPAVLVHYAGGLWGDGHDVVARSLPGRVVPIGMADAVHNYAGNSRQVNRGVLVNEDVSAGFVAALERLGLVVHRVQLLELFGKAGGGPACATLQLPRSVELPATSPLRYSVNRAAAQARKDQIPERLHVAPEFFAGKPRG
jgi:hypothetical protein